MAWLHKQGIYNMQSMLNFKCTRNETIRLFLLSNLLILCTLAALELHAADRSRLSGNKACSTTAPENASL